MYLIKNTAIQLVFDVALGKGGLGKTGKEITKPLWVITG